MLKQFTREEKSWIFYDWANSAQSAIVAAIILPIFFKTMARGSGVSDVDSTAYWGYATSLGTLICALLAPLLGTLGDMKGYRKRLFTFFLLVGVGGTALLALSLIHISWHFRPGKQAASGAERKSMPQQRLFCTTR